MISDRRWQDVQEDALISVIIPVYKVEALLDRCLDSVCRQSYARLEIILVDDGSPDRCGQMCEEYAKKDARIVVCHKVNGGLSDARNYGTARSRGEYITFIDSDDYVSEHYVAYLYALLKENEADASACCRVRTEEDHTVFPCEGDTGTVFSVSGREACRLLFDQSHLDRFDTTAWGKLYRADVVKRFPFPVGRLFEDVCTTPKYYFNSRRVAFGDETHYGYYINPNGIMKSKARTRKAKDDAVWVLADRADYYTAQGDTALARRANDVLFNTYVRERAADAEMTDKELAPYFRKRELSGKVRLAVLLYSLWPKLFWRIWMKRNGSDPGRT